MYFLYGPVSISLFLCAVGAFAFLTDREPGTLSRMLVAAAAIAVASHLGKRQHDLIACALLLAAVAYAFIVVRSSPAPND